MTAAKFTPRPQFTETGEPVRSPRSYLDQEMTRSQMVEVLRGLKFNRCSRHRDEVAELEVDRQVATYLIGLLSRGAHRI